MSSTCNNALVIKNSFLLFPFFIFLCLNQPILSTTSEEFFLVRKPHLEIDPELDQLHKQKVLEEAKQKMGEKVDEAKVDKDEPNEQDKALYEESFAQAPLKLKTLVEDMLRGEEYTKRYKSILLAGPTGAGKSTLAKAIAYKLGKKCRVVNAPSLLGHYRDQAAEKVRDVFEEWRQDEEKRMLIFEEINALTDDYTSEHSDTMHTAMQTWTLIDEFKEDDDFFMVATSNRTKKMPHQFQSRYKARTFFIDLLSEAASRRTLEFCIKTLGVTRDETCTDTYLTELAKKTVNFSPRDIEGLIDTALLLFSAENRNEPIKKLSKAYLEKAYSEIVQENEKLWDFTEHTTDEERRHNENRTLQIKLAQLNLLYQALAGRHPDVKRETMYSALSVAEFLAFPGEESIIARLERLKAMGALKEETKGWFSWLGL